MSTPPSTTKPIPVPAVGKSISVRVDKLLHEDLEVMARSGMNTTEAVRYCLNMLAHAYTAAWRQGTPEGEIPEGLAITKIG